MADNVRFVEPSVVAELVKGPVKETVAVVDVRDEDFAGGHVRGAINLWSEKFADAEQVDKLIDEQLAGKERVVVHCMLSQQRGPASARRLAERLQERGLQQPQVLVMSGGWQQFSRQYGEDETLVEHGSAAGGGGEANGSA